MSGRRQIAVVGRGRVTLTQGPLPPDAPDKSSGRTICSLISPGTEWNLYLDPVGELRHPLPGYAAIVRVDTVGEDVTVCAPGDRVLCTQPHADRQRFRQGWTWPVPTACPAPVAAIARLAGVAMANLLTTRVPSGSRVLVTGLGPIGLCAAGIFADHGYEVLAVDPQARCREHATALGLAAVPACTDLINTAARSCDLHLACAGVEAAIYDALPLMRPGGEISLVGVPWRRTVDTDGHALLAAVFHDYLTLRSGWEWQLPIEHEHLPRGTTREAMQRALAWVTRRRDVLGGLVELVDPMDCQQVYDDVRAGRMERPFVGFGWDLEA